MAHHSAWNDAAGRREAGGPGGGAGTGPAAVRRRVLLVEDNRNLRVTTSRMLEYLGYRVAAAASGAEAVAAYADESARPDVVLLDVRMPGMDGLATLRAIRAIVPDARVVVYSGSPDELRRAESEGGASAVLAKPYDVASLAAALQRALEPHGH